MGVTAGNLIQPQDWAHLNTLANAPAAGLVGRPYAFGYQFILANTFTDLVTLYQADNGSYPAAIAILRDDKTAWQLNGRYNTPLGAWQPFNMLFGASAGSLAFAAGSFAFVTQGPSGYPEVLWGNNSVRDRVGRITPQWSSYWVFIDGAFTVPLAPTRLELRRIWSDIMHGSKMVRSDDAISSTSPARIPSINTARYSFGPAVVTLRRVWGLRNNNPLPLTAWSDAMRNVSFVFDAAAVAPALTATLLLPDPSAAFMVGLPPFGTGETKFRIQNAPHAGTLTGSITLIVRGALDSNQPPQIQGNVELVSSTTNTFVNDDPAPGVKSWHCAYTIKAPFAGGEFKFSFVLPPLDPVFGQLYGSDANYNFQFDLLSQQPLKKYLGINSTGGLSIQDFEGTQLDGAPSPLASLNGQIFITLGGVLGWHDVSLLSIDPKADGSILAIPAPISGVYVESQGSSPTLGGLAAEGALVNNIFIAPAVLWRPPRWPARRSTAPTYNVLKANFFSFRFSLIESVYVARLPDPFYPANIPRVIADRPSLDVVIGCLQAGAFVPFQTVTIPAGELVAIPIYPKWIVFTNDPLVYNCTENVNIQAMISLANPSIIGGPARDVGANIELPSQPLAAQIYNDLEWTLQQLALP